MKPAVVPSLDASEKLYPMPIIPIRIKREVSNRAIKVREKIKRLFMEGSFIHYLRWCYTQLPFQDF
jgi:hypothetical protein